MKDSNCFFFGAALLAALNLTGCAFAYEGKYDWHQGWHEARVVKTGNAEALGGRRFSDCRYMAAGEPLATSQFVVLSYEHMSRWRHRVVPLRPGEAYQPDELLLMNLRSCDAPLVARNGAILK
jgi:hypothetical protein